MARKFLQEEIELVQEQDLLQKLVDELVCAYGEFISRQSCLGQTMDFQLRCSNVFARLYEQKGSMVEIRNSLATALPDYLFHLTPDGQGCLEVIAREHIPPPIIKKSNRPARHEIPTPSISMYVAGFL